MVQVEVQVLIDLVRNLRTEVDLLGEHMSQAVTRLEALEAITGPCPERRDSVAYSGDWVCRLTRGHPRQHEFEYTGIG